MGNQVGRDDALVETLTLNQKGGSWKLTVHDHHVTLVWEGVKGSVQGFCCIHLPFLFLCGQGCVRHFGSSSCTYYASSGKIKEIMTEPTTRMSYAYRLKKNFK